jgi:ADP-heptose:LPS heptosyltransferase|tara:strand:+ start:1311 stop:2345 length:1035 start_codon:yes stop_codon:yes gene_type:complete
MGDTLWGTPAIRAIKKALPRVGIDLLLQPQWKSLFYENNNIRRLISYSPRWYRQIIGLPKLLGTRYDHVLIFHANKDIRRVLPWVRCSSIWSHQQVTYIPPGCDAAPQLPGVPSNQIVRFEKPVHGILRRMAMLEKIQIASNGTHMDIFLNNNDRAEVLLFLKQHRIMPKEFIYLNVGGSIPKKQWPVDKCISLAKLVLQNTSLAIVLGGGPEDTDRVDSIEKQLDRQRVARATHRPLRANCALIAQARMLITPDSGPMHVGFALKIPTIALFYSMDKQGQNRNELNGPEYCGPLEIGKDLCAVMWDNFQDTKKEGDPGHFVPNPILVSEVWEKVQDFLKLKTE